MKVLPPDKLTRTVTFLWRYTICSSLSCPKRNGGLDTLPDCDIADRRVPTCAGCFTQPRSVPVGTAARRTQWIRAVRVRAGMHAGQVFVWT
jgi:hypothetical protein